MTSSASSSPRVSVVLPVYNAQEYLPRCLDSILAQSLKDMELVCVDDGSSDDSPAILRAYAEEDLRMRVVTQENAGPGAARNAGLRLARGEYLSFLDADDFFEPSMLKRAYARARRKKAQLVVFAADDYRADEETYTPISYGIRSNMLPRKQPFAGVDIERDAFKVFVGWTWDKLFERSFVEERGLRFQKLRSTDDMRFVFAAISAAERIATLPGRPLVHHRRLRGSVSATREDSWHCFHDALVSLRAQLEAWGLFEHYEQDFVNYCVHASLWNCKTLAEPARTMLVEKLRDEWFDEFGVTQHPCAYFYDKGEYGRYKQLVS